MAVYVSLLILLILVSIGDFFYFRKSEKVFWTTFLCIVIFFIIGLRNNGYDYISYQGLLEDAHLGIISPDSDIGFYFLCKHVGSYRELLLVMSFITVFCIYRVLKQYSVFPIVSLVILSTTLLYPTFMGQMRQGFAIMLMLLAYFNRDKKTVFISLFIIAFLFHSSSILTLLFLLPLKKVYQSKIYVLILIISSYSGPFIEFALSKLSFIRGAIMNKIAFYSYTESEQGLSIGFNTAIYLRIAIFFMCYFLIKRNKAKIDTQMLNLYFISIVFYLALGFIPQIGGRGALYFAAFDILLIPQILKSSYPKYRIILYIGFVMISIMRFISFFSDTFNNSLYVPYFQ